MPIGGESRNAPNYSVEIQGSSDDKTRAIAILEGPPDIYGNYSWNSLEELLSDVVKMLAGTLTVNGRSFHKIAKIEKNSGTYLLHNFLCQRFFYGFGRYIQIIPKTDRFSSYKNYYTFSSPWDKAYVIFPKRDIWTIEMPKELGGYRGHRTMLKKLVRFPYREDKDFFIAKITERWGWSRLYDSQENCTEFYDVYRYLTLKWTQACMREHIINEFNELFQRLNIDAEIIVKGLLTTQEILQLRQQMCEGKISFNDAFEKCSV